ncbi:hypothetical protein GYMLUDRAFT_42820 [Collybiopsis luxurians FD-317 M1]|uniref:TFIIS central domain-containing protein n=1 Tax=Collybiopsis luxurians FD-317 M1 TaxID=944289 RepID=A0A0D0C0Q9_9AGAR|nr:hypothetical protein GYMLUDRAFT_42820 [Collybiopsis luxurians FD-317 M1]
MSWEESDPIDEVSSKRSGPASVASRQKSRPPKDPTPTEPPLKLEDLAEPSSASEDSDDDYVVDAKAKGNRGKRRTRRASYVSESELSDLSDASGPRIRKASSPTLKRIAKRNSGGPPSKKVKTSDPLDDPTRKYCLGKLEDVFRDIFLRYPHVRSKSEDDDDDAVLPQVEEKQAEDLTEEEKKAVLEDSKQFADDLEKCVFEIYSEPDKHGKPAAAAKYKDRFRMLQFNLSKIDRVVLHKRIVTGHITPKEISVMSSTDLANEELKQSIKSAEQESLEQSILTKTAAPRAKITHKGLEDIEDVSGRDSLRERERQLEEEERMERERLARLRTGQPRQRTMSISVPPESPVVPSSDSWGAPPPVPAHASDMMMDSVPTRPPLFLNTSSEVISEPELNLADLINIDDEPGSAQDTSNASDPQPLSSSTDQIDPSPVSLPSPAGISPFAIQPAPSPSVNQSASPALPQPPTPRIAAPAFDLNTLWSLSKSDTSSTTPRSPTLPEPAAKSDVEASKDVTTDRKDNETNDQDFDMFLEEKEPEKEPEKAEDAQARFDARPQVWAGKINMPLDSTTPQEALVVGRQMGGRSIDVTSGQWKTLFPSDTLRIDGRVPIADSAKFLLQMSMNLTKELVAVAFSPSPGTDGSVFTVLSQFLIKKGRHGLVFPWGSKPKDHHPGKELYLIPLLADEPLPDYMELLEDLRLPRLRTINYLVGIWILSKGKLTSPPPSTTPVIPTVTPAPALAPVLPTTHLTPPPTVVAPSVNRGPDMNIVNLAATLPIDQNALLAELASLTPEQMAYVTQMLAGAKAPAVPTPVAPAHSPIPAPSAPTSSSSVQIPMPVPPLPLPSDRHWAGQQQYPSGGVPSGIAAPPSFSRGGRGNSNPRGRGDRGGRGGRGRGRGRDEDFHMHGPVDSGWPQKSPGQRKL